MPDPLKQTLSATQTPALTQSAEVPLTATLDPIPRDAICAPRLQRAPYYNATATLLQQQQPGAIAWGGFCPRRGQGSHASGHGGQEVW